MARTALWRLYEIAVHYAIPAPAVEPFVAIEGVEVGANVKRRGGGCLPLSLTGREDRVFAPFRVFRETPYRGTILAVLDYRRRSSMQLSEVERQYDRAFHVSPGVKPALKVGCCLLAHGGVGFLPVAFATGMITARFLLAAFTAVLLGLIYQAKTPFMFTFPVRHPVLSVSSKLMSLSAATDGSTYGSIRFRIGSSSAYSSRLHSSTWVSSSSRVWP
jgi:hypothetical protein